MFPSCRYYYLYLCSDMLQKIILLHSNKLHPLSTAEQAGENLQSINISKIKILFTQSIYQGEKELIVEVPKVLLIPGMSYRAGDFGLPFIGSFWAYLGTPRFGG